MEKEDRLRMIMVMLLGIVIFLAWDKFFGRKDEPPPPQPPSQGAVQPDTPGPTPPDQPEFEVQSRPPDDVAAYEGPVLGGAAYLGRYAMAMQVTARGAGVRHVELSDYFASVGDVDKPADERTKFQLVQPGEGQPAFVLTRLSLVTRRNERFAIDQGLADAWWTPEGPATENEAAFTLDVHRQGKPLLTIRKTIRLHPRAAAMGEDAWDRRFTAPAAYAARMGLTFTDHTGTLSSVSFTMRGPEGLVKEETRGDGRLAAAGSPADGGQAEFKTAKDAGKEDKNRFAQSLDWAGAVNKYFAFVAVIDPEDPAGRFATAQGYAYKDSADTELPGILMDSRELSFGGAGADLTVRYLLFAGPKDEDLLKAPMYAGPGLRDLVQWSGGCCCGAGLPGVTHLARFMVLAIDWISRLVVNKGVAVIILVILIQIVLLPISRFSQLSMLKMQELQPELKRIKEQFKDDKQQQQVEQMKLMRERGVNPMLGCLPMMLQMPIWIALFTGLRVAISLRHEPFFLWIKDLSQPDALMAIPKFSFPLLTWVCDWAGWQLNLLPLLMVAAMFLQMKQQPVAAAGASPESAAQQKMMKFMMPGMMLIFFYPAPAALNLYILTSSFIRFWEQKYIRWHHEQIKKRPPKPQKPRRQGFFSRWFEKKMEDVRRLGETAKRSENPFEGKGKKRKKQ